ncbi:DUF1850 domain-containing protein [Lysinibacillus sp. LZ02]|uniref:DUF1850 domain-containing protein n=1 Tax=Lysinibacillus sp. LZ02 TaxID=3420668 RepID=UPI003D35D77C
MKKVWWGCLTIAAAIVFLFIPIFPVFSFIETRTEKTEMYYLEYDEDPHFQIVFTHSIHLTDVVESYEALPTYDIRLHSMRYSDVAIGMPGYAEEGQTLIYEDGIYTLYYDNAVLPNFTLYIGDVDYTLRFEYRGKTYNLKENLSRGKSYLFEIKKVSIYDKMKGVELYGG